MNTIDEYRIRIEAYETFSESGNVMNIAAETDSQCKANRFANTHKIKEVIETLNVFGVSNIDDITIEMMDKYCPLELDYVARKKRPCDKETIMSNIASCIKTKNFYCWMKI